MENHDVDDIFEDFGNKVEGTKESQTPKKELSEEELLKRKYKKAEEVLKEQHRKEREALEEKRKKEMPHGRAPTKNFTNIERIAYIAIILVLALYIIIDLSFFNGEKDIGTETDQPITAAAVKEENKTTEVEEEKVIEEEKDIVIKEEKKLSGVITLTIDKIYT